MSLGAVWTLGNWRALASLRKAGAVYLQPSVAVLEYRPLVTDPVLVLLFERKARNEDFYVKSIFQCLQLTQMVLKYCPRKQLHLIPVFNKRYE